jgi:hypothetical protein
MPRDSDRSPLGKGIFNPPIYSLSSWCASRGCGELILMCDFWPRGPAVPYQRLCVPPHGQKSDDPICSPSPLDAIPNALQFHPDRFLGELATLAGAGRRPRRPRRAEERLAETDVSARRRAGRRAGRRPPIGDRRPITYTIGPCWPASWPAIVGDLDSSNRLTAVLELS